MLCLSRQFFSNHLVFFLGFSTKKNNKIQLLSINLLGACTLTQYVIVVYTWIVLKMFIVTHFYLFLLQLHIEDRGRYPY